MATESLVQQRGGGALVIDRGASAALARVDVLQERMQIITAVMANVLVDGRDYGKVPGTDKPSLWKAGAEKLMLTFSLAPLEPIVEDLTDSEQIRYRVKVPIESADGRILAVGIGEASTSEEKYRWRRPVCDEEFEATPESMRRIKWAKGDNGKGYPTPQVRTSPADLANTVLKMAHKRGLIQGTLMATGASSVFNQKEDALAKELVDSRLDPEAAPKVRRASERPAAASTTAGAMVTDARRVKDVRGPFGKTNSYALILEGDATEYTTKDQKHALEFERFKGTDHKLRVTYRVNDWQGKTYHNIDSFAVEDVAPAAPMATVPPASTTPLVAGDIPFGK